MSGGWKGSGRRSELPANWAQIRAEVGARDRWSCQWRVPGQGICGERANQCDHIVAGGSDAPHNLQMLCERHHAMKSSGEGGRASAAAFRALKKSFERPVEKNPQAPPPAAPPKHRGF